MTAKPDNPFDRFPQLPVVPVPWPGEALGGWFRAAIRPYSLTVSDFMHHLGLPWSEHHPRFDVRVLLQPPEKFLQALNETTGISICCLRSMTSDGLDPDLADACFQHYSPCAIC